MRSNLGCFRSVLIALLTSSLTMAETPERAGLEKGFGGTVSVHNFLGSPVDQIVEILRSR